VKKRRLRFGEGFRVIRGNRRSQAAEMVLPPGDSEGGTDNRHRGADQWLFVLSGTGEALIGRKRHRLGKGDLVLIEKKEKHQIKNTGRAPLRTLNFYVPPAYRRDGNPMPRGKK
jgi:mannose-6-phosphate isomerase-like protein (cupin superfamily)